MSIVELPNLKLLSDIELKNLQKSIENELTSLEDEMVELEDKISEIYHEQDRRKL